MARRPLNVFISYSRADSAFVDKLEEALKAHGYYTWVDRSKLTGTIAGDPWLSRIFQAISECDVFLLVLSPDAVKSAIVSVEYGRASERSKTIIPLLWRACEIPPVIAAASLIRMPENVDATLQSLVERLKDEVPGGDRIVVDPRFGFPLLSFLTLLSIGVTYVLHLLLLFYLVFLSATLATLIKNLTYRFGEGTPSRDNPIGQLSFFLGQIVRYLLLLLAGFFAVLAQHLHGWSFSVGIFGAGAGMAVGVWYVLELLLSGTYRTVIKHARARASLRKRGYSPRLARVLAVSGTTLGWTLGGLVGGALGSFLASQLNY
jgi:hypothetical protein